MKEYNPKLPLISIHIPKCGGTSFRYTLQNWFNDRLYFHYINERKGKMPEKHYLKKPSSDTFFENICVHGHFSNKRKTGVNDYYPEINQYITFLRDPLEIQLSLFHYNLKLAEQKNLYINGKPLKMAMNIDKFLETSNSYLKYFFPIGLDIESIEKDFVHVGVIELYQNSINILADKLNKPRVKVAHENKAERRFTPSASAVRCFKEKCSLEYELYEKAFKANSATISEI